MLQLVEGAPCLKFYSISFKKSQGLGTKSRVGLGKAQLVKPYIGLPPKPA